jgi:signal transduction histidine kinase
MSAREVIVNVDDSEPSRYAKSRILSHAGFTVHEARNGAEALTRVAQHNPDLVLLDINLPDLSGIEVCRRLRASPSASSVLILQISASSTTAPHATAALDNGADSYLAEPVDPDVLVATVKALLRLRKAERDLLLANERLKAMNQELSRSNEDLQQFAYVASHDLQEPLRTIATFVSLVQRTAKAKLTAAEMEYLEHIVDGSRRMRTLIDDLLQYSQLDMGTTTAAPVKLNAPLQWALENLGQAISQSGAVVTAEELPIVAGDATQLGHVFQNLLGNAIKYGKPGVRPEIHVSASEEASDSVICIRDNGIGIDSAYLQQIFAPFKRLHGKEIAGTGIGLAVSRRIIEAHKGRIWAQSVPGDGATFCFSLMKATGGGASSGAN